MKGYKMLDMNMCAIHGDGMAYDFDRIYELEGIIIPCVNGFHFCSCIEDTILWYTTFNNHRLFEVDTLDGDIVKEPHKFVTNKIKIIREIPFEEILEYLNENSEKLYDYTSHSIIKRELNRLRIPRPANNIFRCLPEDHPLFLAI